MKIMTKNESLTLYYQAGNSDKVYKLDLESLESAEDSFIVTAWFGRRGAALKEQRKTPAPLPYAEAKKVFDAVVTEKTRKGYAPGEGGPAYVSAKAGERTGIALHLLTPTPEAEVERYLSDDAYFAQEKIDGERRPVARRGKVIGSNRNGFATPLPRVLAEVLSALPDDTEIDGEQIGDTLHVFDLLRLAGEDIRALPALERFLKLEALVAGLRRPEQIVLVKTAHTSAAKRELYACLRKHRKEGIVFKRGDAPYVPGRSGAQIKIKFIESATLQVAAVHPTKRSVSVRVFTPEGLAVPLGNVTIPANHAIPAVGEICEVEYLYVVTHLVQPIYKGLRADRTPEACTTSQLKYRAGMGEEADDVDET
jgi:bifunctional non-homologous end joining protein LigD